MAKTKENAKTNSENCTCKGASARPINGSGIYGMGVIGTAFFFFQHASTTNDYIFAVVKAIFWPAFLIYQAWAQLGN